MAPSSSAATTSVQVALRIRPPTPQDATSIPSRFQRTIIHTISTQAVSVDPTPSGASSVSATAGSHASMVSVPGKKQVFSFDQVHGPDTTQHHLFVTTAEPLISRFLEGFNCTILAYGQTSSGKTYSMTGLDLDADPSDPHNGMGVIPRSVSTIFARAKELKEERAGAWSYSIKGSFVELYNEDLIDLLSLDDGGGERREVQIREDKDGHIIWGGLREVAVKNASEVMGLIRQGTAIRRTNETEMNAQSSRSHAIFSLTLTQKKYTGSGQPPRSTTPQPPGGRSPSRLARPVSTFSSGSARVSSPTFGRPPTPSFASAMGRAGGGLRPSSALGSHSADGRARNVEEDVSEVTIISKFHFVDLAGSERLKRTAAAGDRIKEGISINSGLLALGNVISALGDPSRAKSHTASHVPYRDSKLTRLLQDSLGGNAHTLMIACVSPAEWNAGETVNTLKYANRARNIKNRAVVMEKEEGWDDIEWLQNMVTRLRKDVKGLKDGGAVSGAHGPGEHVELEGASKKVLSQMVQLQGNYENLRAKFVERTEELTRLRRELGEKQRSATSGAVGGTSKYEEIVGPVIEEYEKTISAMEAELSLNRAALRHTNDLVEETEEELAVITERHAATEMYVEELKSRVHKLSEREASTEAYIHDLEEKVKNHEDISISSSDSVSDLKREIARHKDEEERSSRYIADLESRLARSDESVLSLRETVEKLEQDAATRRAEVEVLQSRLNTLLNDGEAWRSDLEEREKRVRELEVQMEEWEAKRHEANEDRIRIGGLVDGVQHARQSLEVDMASAAKVNGTGGSGRPSPVSEKGTPLESQLTVLRETHAATLADLSSVTSKYRDALREISDLAAQIAEAKIHSPSRSDSPERILESPQIRRGLVSGRVREFSDGQVNSSGKRLFFRQAASTESLHSRSQSQSQLLSQELFSARSRKKSFPGTNGLNSPHSRSSSSLSSRPHLSISLPVGPTSPGERSVASLEKEIMRLQEVLEERELEITTLEKTIKESEHTAAADVLSKKGDTLMANGHATPLEDLTAKTKEHFAAIRRSMELRHPAVEGDSTSEADDPLDRLNELMLSMAQKESRHREIVDDLNEQLTFIRRQHDDLSKLSHDQALNMSTELEVARKEHSEVLIELENLQQRESSLLEEREATEEIYVKAMEALQSEYEQSMRDKEAEVESLISQIKEEHDGVCSSLRDQLTEASEMLAKSHQDYGDGFGKLKADHEAELQRLKQETDDILNRSKEVHKDALTKADANHQDALRARDEGHTSILQHTEEEYYVALDKLRKDHAEVLSRKEAEFAADVERIREELAGQQKMAEIAREGSLTDSQSSHAALLQRLQDEHTVALDKKEAAYAEDLRRVNEENVRMLSRQEEEHNVTLAKLRSNHSAKLADLEGEMSSQMQALNEALVESQRTHEMSSLQFQQQLNASSKCLQEQHSTILEEVARSHEEEMAEMKAKYDASQAQATAASEDLGLKLKKDWAVEVAKIKGEHQLMVAELQANLIAAQEQHRQDLQEARMQTKVFLAQEREHLEKAMADLEKLHADERETLRKDNDILVEELASHKAASDEFATTRDQTRIAHESALQEKDDIIDDLKESLDAVQDERSSFHAELEKLRAELDQSRSEQARLVQEAAQRISLAEELERHRSLLSDVRNDLQKTRDHRDSLLAEKNKQDSALRDLQSQLTRSMSPPAEGHMSRPPTDRNPSYSRVNGISSSKLPPLTPPPSVPPPPAPKTLPSLPTDVSHSTSSHSSNMRSSSSSRESQPDSPLTSAVPSIVNGLNITEPKIVAHIEEQSRQIEEQEVMIKTLNKQLTHCESDLQAHMDLVSTLETSLGDSEKNLRKARMQATELARERDTLGSQIEKLRTDLDDSHREVANVRRSVVEEKQNLEHRLDEERRAKERARAQLDSRVEELQKRKSKFVCL